MNKTLKNIFKKVFNTNVIALASVMLMLAVIALSPFDKTQIQEVQATTGNLTPLFRLWNPNIVDHFYTVSEAERNNAVNNLGYIGEGVTAFVHTTDQDGTVSLFRLWSPRARDHFYTRSEEERNNAVAQHGYMNEGTVGFIHTEQVDNTTPLFRLNHPIKFDHFYTTSTAERDNAISQHGYVNEGVVGFVDVDTED